MTNKSEKFYEERLRKYYKKNFLEKYLEEPFAFYVNPAINIWRIDSPIEFNGDIYLTCDDNGKVTEKIVRRG